MINNNTSAQTLPNTTVEFDEFVCHIKTIMFQPIEFYLSYLDRNPEFLTMHLDEIKDQMSDITLTNVSVIQYLLWKFKVHFIEQGTFSAGDGDKALLIIERARTEQLINALQDLFDNHYNLLKQIGLGGLSGELWQYFSPQKRIDIRQYTLNKIICHIRNSEVQKIMPYLDANPKLTEFKLIIDAEISVFQFCVLMASQNNTITDLSIKSSRLACLKIVADQISPETFTNQLQELLINYEINSPLHEAGKKVLYGDFDTCFNDTQLQTVKQIAFDQFVNYMCVSVNDVMDTESYQNADDYLKKRPQFATQTTNLFKAKIQNNTIILPRVMSVFQFCVLMASQNNTITSTTIESSSLACLKMVAKHISPETFTSQLQELLSNYEVNSLLQKVLYGNFDEYFSDIQIQTIEQIAFNQFVNDIMDPQLCQNAGYYLKKRPQFATQTTNLFKEKIQNNTIKLPRVMSVFQFCVLMASQNNTITDLSIKSSRLACLKIVADQISPESVAQQLQELVNNYKYINPQLHQAGNNALCGNLNQCFNHKQLMIIVEIAFKNYVSLLIKYPFHNDVKTYLSNFPEFATKTIDIDISSPGIQLKNLSTLQFCIFRASEKHNAGISNFQELELLKLMLNKADQKILDAQLQELEKKYSDSVLSCFSSEEFVKINSMIFSNLASKTTPALNSNHQEETVIEKQNEIKISNNHTKCIVS